MHTIEEYPDEHRVTIVFERFDDHFSELFFRKIKEATLSVKRGSDYFDMISIFAGDAVMPQDIASESKQLAVWLLENGLRKSANIVDSSTQRMQISRVTLRDERFGFFSTIEEAHLWLKEGRP